MAMPQGGSKPMRAAEHCEFWNGRHASRLWRSDPTAERPGVDDLVAPGTIRPRLERPSKVSM
jgi:hypothetical protein